MALGIFQSLEKIFKDHDAFGEIVPDISTMNATYTLTYSLPNGRLVKNDLPEANTLQAASVVAEKILASGVRRVEIQETNTIVVGRQNHLRLVAKGIATKATVASKPVPEAVDTSALYDELT